MARIDFREEWMGSDRFSFMNDQGRSCQLMLIARLFLFTPGAKLKAAGGRWNPEERLWRVRYGSIRGDAGLVERIVRK